MGIAAVSHPHEHAWSSVGEMWRHYVPAYRSGVYRPFFAKLPYGEIPRVAVHIRDISHRRSQNRIDNYVDRRELDRVKDRGKDCSIRFGVRKPGHGYGKKRGDFCLVSGVYTGGQLTLFYRSIELIGGLAYDLVLIDEVVRSLGIKPKVVNFWAVKAFVFALRGNSNEKLYPKLKAIYQ